MDLSSGFRGEGKYKGNVFRLRKSLYGLKKSSCAWFFRFSVVVISMGFTRCQSDPKCFIRHRNGQCVIHLVYVDDIIITGDDYWYLKIKI